jgi:tetratricopeptide (TPR) repeat protein
MSETNSPESDPGRHGPPAVPARASSKKATAPRGRGSWLLWLIVLALGGLILVVELPYEMARWKYVAALEAREAGQKEKAYEYLSQAMEKLPDRAQYRQQLAQWKQEDGEYAESLELVEELCRQYPEEPSLLMLRSQLYMHLNRADEAIADVQVINRISEATGIPSRGEALNQLAYFRALGKVDLDQAWEDANLAVKEATAELEEAEAEFKALVKEKKDSPGHALKVAIARRKLAGVLDTRGYVDFQREKFEAAQADYDRAIALLDLSDEHLKKAKGNAEAGQRMPEGLAYILQNQNQHRAVMLYHRALNLQKLARDKDAEADLAQVRELIGHEPDDTLF